MPRLSVRHAQLAVSAFIRERVIAGEQIVILDNALIDRALMVPRPTLLESSRRLLLECGQRTHKYDEDVFKPMLPLVAITWSEDEAEVQALADLLREEGFLKKGAAAEFRLTARGLSTIEIEQSKSMIDQVFVAMSFDKQLNQVYDNSFAIGIAAAGYKPFRVDRHDHINRIDDEIIAQIRRSRFLVADFTGHKAGVYFEAGFALGLGRNVIWTCQKADLKDLHFDIRQYNNIVWEKETDLARSLQLRIEAVVGSGPRTIQQ
jgi:nucleoside 2-deoxyribosyltransferase